MGALSLANPPCGLSPRLRRRFDFGLKDGRAVPLQASSRSIRCTASLTVGGDDGEGYIGTVLKYPRRHVWNPYKRLGLGADASEEEVREARNFLIQQYAGHESSYESIEDAYDKLLMSSFRLRKKTKINLKTRLKKKVEESPPWFKRLLEYVELPPMDVILRRMFLFAFMAAWSIMNSAETGPAFQLALSLGSCIYFLNDKMSNVARASVTGFGALVLGWLCGSVVVPTIPSFLLKPMWTLELMTSLVCYVFLFLACTFLK
ncbi:unnamed protein product [Spirodela intermedia]|uniref:Uncharacterized protein n=1 Tax=Spirodela intermedia TaxID=51605 RepID=A0A7I8KE26_SPIIN|nr:unnamed protein product [Spirodela intermedia]